MNALVRTVLLPGKPMRWFACVASLAWFALLIILGSASAGSGWLPSPADKLAHFLYYGSLAGMIWVALGGTTRATDLITGVIIASLGALDEIIQAYIPGRDPSLFDWYADILGAVVAVVTLRLSRNYISGSRPLA